MTDTPDTPIGATLRTPVLSLLDDQTSHWQQGERVSIESYLANHAFLSSDAEALLDLVYNEVRLRDERGEAPRLEEYQRRFPDLADLLAIQFEVHQALRPGQELAALSWDEEGVCLGPHRPVPVVAGYEVLEELGRGAMGVVYRARQVRLKRLVALKMILAGPHAGARERARFENEAQAVARLQHPHIVQIHEIGEAEGRPFLCMELVRGGTLAQKLAAGPLPSSLAARLVETLARAVHHAHEEQIVHRDLKPSNVLLSGESRVPGDEERPLAPKITDFGLAKLLDREADGAEPGGTDLTQGPVGTPPYMAPEQASATSGCGGAVGPGRSIDVYALGAILYESLTGRPPFRAATVLETLEQVRSLEPVPPRRLNPGVPRDLETICLACLRKEPQRRYATALDLADDLRRFLDGRPIRQRPAAFWEPAVKWARRRPAAAAWVVLGVLALLGLFAGGLYVLQHRQAWARERALGCYRQFLQLRDEALFQGTLLEALRRSSSDQPAPAANAARDAARQALALAGFAEDGPSLPSLDAYLSPAEKEEMADSCYELLIVLSTAVAAPRPGQSAARRQEQVGEALRILDGTARWRGPTRAYHLGRASLLGERGDAPGAAEERRKAESLRPASASDYYLSGVCQDQAGHTTRAADSMEAALRLRPNHFEARFYQAIVALKAGQPGEAVVGLTACIARRPDFAWSYLVRGQAAMRQNKFADAEADFATALALDSSDSMRYGVLARRGLIELQCGRLERAAADLEEAVRLHPERWQVRLTLAQVYREQKRWQEAIAALDTAVGLGPREATIYRTRGHFHRKHGDRQLALLDLDRAVRLEQPGNVRLIANDHVARARLLLTLGRPAEAGAACDEALRLRPDHGEALQLRGEVLLALGRFDGAERLFSRCIRQGWQEGDVYRGRGLARMRQGDFPGAVEDYSQALLGKRDAEILQHRGWAFFFADAWKLARRDFDEAIRLKPQTHDAFLGRGLARVMLGDYRGAVADAEEARRANRLDTPEKMHNLACIYSLAAGRAKVDAREPQRQVLEESYRRQAVEALRKTLPLLPRSQRLSFWQKQMRPDPALDPIRDSADFSRLDRTLQRQYPSAGSPKK